MVSPATAAMEIPPPGRDKFGEAMDGGFQVVPDVLLKYQKRLGLQPLDLGIVLNIMMHWWTADEKPFPRMKMIADRMGVSPRTVERRVKSMEKAGLLRRLPSEKRGGLTIRRFDLDGLVGRLKSFANEDPVAASRRRRS